MILIIGASWPTTLAFYLASYFTVNDCKYDVKDLKASTDYSLEKIIENLDKNYCSFDEESKVNWKIAFFLNFLKYFKFQDCVNFGGKCVTLFDAYYLLTVVCVIIGILWLFWKKKTVYNLQYVSKSAWKIPENIVKKIVFD